MRYYEVRRGNHVVVALLPGPFTEIENIETMVTGQDGGQDRENHIVSLSIVSQ